jgi:hypothetical protein
MALRFSRASVIVRSGATRLFTPQICPDPPMLLDVLPTTLSMAMNSSAETERIDFEDFSATDELVRMIFLRRLRRDRNWKSIDLDGWEPYVNFVGNSFPAQLLLRAMRVYWQLVGEGIIHPGRLVMVAPNISGLDKAQFSAPYFSVTRYGTEVLNSPAYEPHYPTSYMAELLQSAAESDDTVTAYMQEAVDSFRRGSLAASMVMLGVAAERVFVLVSEAVLAALDNADEKKRFIKVMAGLSMKPKLDWISHKFQVARKTLPDGSELMVLGVYNLVRLQRNELGHPQGSPPRVSRIDARAFLQMFPPFFTKAQELRAHLRIVRI